MIKFTAVFIVAFTIFSASYSQIIHRRNYNAFSGTLVLTMEGGVTMANTDYSDYRPDFLGRASLEYFVPSYTKSLFGVRLFGSGGFIGGTDLKKSPQVFRTDITSIGGGVVYSLTTNKFVFPYLFAGAAFNRFNPKSESGFELPNNAAGKYKKSEIDYIGELGVRFLVADNLSVNISGGAQFSPNDYFDDKVLNGNNDLIYTGLVGLSYSFFTEYDSDLDGIVDSKDMCPDTPSGIKVDEFGCPLDSDKDGVPDYEDECPKTPKDVKVDEKGCPLNSDGDDIPDYLDLCQGTPRGVKTDEFGCPYDMDADGIPDYQDNCPNTPYNVEVDENGCPVDSDLDGVPDYKDECPDTPAGFRVDEKGCEIIKKEEPVKQAPKEEAEDIKEITLSSASFEFGSTELLPSIYPALDKLINSMKQNPLSRWRVEGYTDNIGSNEANKKVSLQRAQAVVEYFVSKGISKLRFQVTGMGKANPIATNSTEIGRAKNRRVVIKRIN